MSQKTRATITTEINTNLADNITGAITPALLRTVVTDISDSTPNGLTDTSSSLTIVQVTNTVRLTVIYTQSQIIWTTDTNLWYRGDNVTLGGVVSANALAFTRQELINRGIIVNRSQNITAKLAKVIETASTANIPRHFGLGNSIMQQAGADSGFGFETVMGATMSTAIGVGTSTQWKFTGNWGVGGNVMTSPVCYLADSPISGTQTWAPRRVGMFTNVDIVTILSTRNEVSGGLTTTIYREMTRVALQQCKRHKVDAILFIENPTINWTNAGGGVGDITATDLSTFPLYANIEKQIAAQEGASVIDAWTYFKTLQDMGLNLIPFYTSTTGQRDGVHPGNIGHRDMGNLMAELLQSQSIATKYNYDRPLITGGQIQAIATWQNIYDDADVAWTDGTLSTPATNSTARARQLSEATPTIKTQAQFFYMTPAPAVGIIVNWWTSSASTGTASLQIGASGVFVTTFTPPQASIGWEKPVYYPITGADLNNPSTFPFLTINKVSGAQISLVGTVWICPLVTESHDVFPNTVEVGTWSGATLGASTFNYSQAGRTSDSIGDTATLTWYGSQISAIFKLGPDCGKVSYATDGAGATTIDLYSASTGTMRYITDATPTTESWHTTVFTVVAKNASSSDNNVTYSKITIQTKIPDSSYTNISVGSGETVQLVDSFKSAVVTNVISGTPVLKHTKDSSTITLSGGAAVLKLDR